MMTTPRHGVHAVPTKYCRVRHELLRERFRSSPYQTVGELARAARISRSSWFRLLDSDKQLLNLTVLCKVLSVFNMRIEEVLEVVEEVIYVN